MKRTFPTLAIILAMLSPSFAQSFQWAQGLPGAGVDLGFSSVVDSFGNVYSTGWFSGTRDFDPGPGVFNLTSNGGIDTYIEKLDAAGNLIWAKHVGGATDDAPFDIEIDEAGYLYVVGDFSGTVDFDPGPGVALLTVNGSGVFDGFVCKLTNAGDYVWAHRFGGIGPIDEVRDIVLDGQGHFYITGQFNGVADFQPGPGSVNLFAAGVNDMYLAKYDTACNLKWAKRAGSSGVATVGYAAFVDSTGAYASGNFQGTVDFDPGAGTAFLTSTGFNDCFVLKLDTSGNHLWSRGYGGPSRDDAYGMTGDQGGNVWVTGIFEGTSDFDPGAGSFPLTVVDSTDSYLLKLDGAGNFRNAFRIGGTGRDFGYSVKADDSGYVYAGGTFSATVDFDFGPGQSNRTSAGNLDAYFFKVDTVGNLAWVRTIGGPSGDLCYSVDLGPFGEVIATGAFSGTMDVDPGSGTFLLGNGGTSNDMFLLKLGYCAPLSGTDVQSACDSLAWIDGNTYTTSNNTATHVLMNPVGCDSVLTLDLTILNSSAFTDLHTACDTFTWIDANTYTSSNNTATWILPNAAGCDSVVTLDLTILASTSGTDQQTACDTFTWIDNNTYTASNNTATWLLPNAAGCDSLVSLDLTLLNSSSGTDQQIACDTFTWIDGNTYTASNNTATWIIPNAVGCDSLVTLDLSIPVLDTGVTTVGDTLFASAVGASFQWLDCGNGFSPIPGETAAMFIPPTNGSYAVQVTDSGCTDTSACTSVMLNLNAGFAGGVSIFPNPTPGRFALQLSQAQEIVAARVFNMRGKLVYASDLQGAGPHSIEIQGPAGLYLMQLFSEGGQMATLKILKE